MKVVRVSAHSLGRHLGCDVRQMEHNAFCSKMGISPREYTYKDSDDCYYFLTDHPEWYTCYGGDIVPGMSSLPS